MLVSGNPPPPAPFIGRIFFSATMSPDARSRARYTVPYVPSPIKFSFSKRVTERHEYGSIGREFGVAAVAAGTAAAAGAAAADAAASWCPAAAA